MQVAIVFYAVLFRTTLVSAMKEVEKTRHFVTTIPAHLLTLEVCLSVCKYVCVSKQIQKQVEETAQHNQSYHPQLNPGPSQNIICTRQWSCLLRGGPIFFKLWCVS